MSAITVDEGQILKLWEIHEIQEEIIKEKDEMIKCKNKLIRDKDQIIKILKKENEAMQSVFLKITPFKTIEEFIDALDNNKEFAFMQIMRYWQDKINFSEESNNL